MKEIQLTIKALSPLAIGRQKPGGPSAKPRTIFRVSDSRGGGGANAASI